MPGWAKALIIGGGAIAAIATGGYVIYSVITAPVNTYANLLNTQYSEFLKKIAGYTSANPNGYTAAQLQSISAEETIMGQTLKGLAKASSSLTDVFSQAVTEIGIVAGVLGGIFVTIYALAKFNVFPALQAKLGTTAKTSQAMGYATIVTFADYLAESGYPTEAANIMSSAQQLFASYDQPVMQQSIDSLNALIPTLTGIELIIAEEEVEALSLEISIIPEWLALPLPL